MSMYNMLFGMNPDADALLRLLGKTREDFGRFRDVYVDNGYIIVHTRCGGGNRESYEEVFEEMSEHPWYTHDEDDDFDCTYADIYFKIPEGDAAHAFAGLLEPGHDPAELWDKMFKALDAK